MALALSTVRFLFDAYKAGASFKNTLTLGRTQLYLLPSEMKKVRRMSGRELSDEALNTKFGGYADDFLKSLLHIETLAALDTSDYQGASVVHDLNQPVPSEMEGKFDAVIDSGTIEHVFNFPIAIANCMKVVRLGGRLFIITPANNHCGHGFYQFSPELFFRLFKDRNGFQLTRLLLLTHPFPGLELSAKQRLYTVQDPDEMRYRVGLVTDSPVLLLLEAKRRSVEEVLSEFPQQSDYTALWRSGRQEVEAALDNRLPHRFVERLRKLFYIIPEHLMFWPVKKLAMFVAGLYQRHILYSLRNRNYYRLAKPAAVEKSDR